MSGSLMRPFQPTVVRGFYANVSIAPVVILTEAYFTEVRHLYFSIEWFDDVRWWTDSQVGTHNDEEVTPGRCFFFEQTCVL